MITQANLFFIGAALAKCAAVTGVLLFMVAYSVVAERRFSAWIQDRVGPNRVGPFGLLQPFVDGIKFLFKEEYTPPGVRMFYFHLAPVLVMVPAVAAACVVPFGNFIDLRWVGELWNRWAGSFGKLSADAIENLKFPAVVADLDVGILFVFAIVTFGVYGIVLAGWASNSKYPFMGGIRSSAQMISYEISMGLAVIPIFLVCGRLNLSEIVHFQAASGWFVLPLAWREGCLAYSSEGLLLWIPMLISFVVFLVAAFAETNRLPFDMPECETELVGGYHTEYSAMKFALFFLGEYAAMIVTSAIMTTLFLGGWSLPIPWFDGQNAPDWFWPIHILVFIAKTACFIFFFIWVRWTLPRFRYDQLMSLGWKVLIVLGLANIILTSGILAYIQCG